MRERKEESLKLRKSEGKLCTDMVRKRKGRIMRKGEEREKREKEGKER
jgi:hypothetical protein